MMCFMVVSYPLYLFETWFMPYMFANLCAIGINLLYLGIHLMSFGFIAAVDSFYFCNNTNCQIIEEMSKVKYAE